MQVFMNEVGSVACTEIFNWGRAQFIIPPMKLRERLAAKPLTGGRTPWQGAGAEPRRGLGAEPPEAPRFWLEKVHYSREILQLGKLEASPQVELFHWGT